MSVQERIAAKALEMFNQKGIEYVGMRELAAALDTKLGNITYYFPTKEDLIIKIASDLSALNSSILQADSTITLASYLELTRKHFEYQFQYRCLFLSFVHLVQHYDRMAERYKKIEEQRKKSAMTNIENLVKNKYLKPLTLQDTVFLRSAISFISRFWISEAAVSHNKLKPQDQIQHYLSLIANILLPYCTTKGKAQLSEWSVY